MTQRFLFLQGPHGPFFAALARRLQKEGAEVHRINFHGGDAADWPLPGAVDFTQDMDLWPEFLRHYILDNGITDIVLYNYARAVHATAIAMARKKGLRLHGFEEGLFRPYWITLDGRLPAEQASAAQAETLRRAAELPDAVDLDPPPDFGLPCPRQRRGGTWMILRCIRHYVHYFFGRQRFPRYRTHRVVPAGAESRAWIRQFFTYPWRKRVAVRRMKAILSDPRPYYILCLQLGGDSQIRLHSAYQSMHDVMRDVMTRFALYAPRDSFLVVKNHPLDNGLDRLEEMCARVAQENGIADRVVFLAFGKLPRLLKDARGLVTVNSSAGLQALYHGCPVRTLGYAVYNVPGLTDTRTAQEFWASPQGPSARVYNIFHNLLQETSQHQGNFYMASFYPTMLESIVPRMLVTA